jgi:hypothetical protein
MRNFPESFSYFLIFHEFTEAKKQERLQWLRELVIQLLMILKEGKEERRTEKRGEKREQEQLEQEQQKNLIIS